MRKCSLLLFFVFGTLTSPLGAQPRSACEDLRVLIQTTYNFKPSKLSPEDRKAKGKLMDKVWEVAKANPKALVPCLRAAIEDPNADSWFRFDGANLLVELDQSPASKKLQVLAYTGVDLEDVHLQVWVQTLSARGEEGFDVGEAAARWLAYPGARYFLAAHGAFEVKTFQGALFILGSMDEAQAMPVLMNILGHLEHPGREAALWILMSQATTESLRALRNIDTTGLSPQIRDRLRALLDGPELISPSPKPRVSRKELLKVLEAAARTDWPKIERLRDNLRHGGSFDDLKRAMKPWDDFMDLFWGGEPTERDAAAVLTMEDLPLLRKIRRRMIVSCNQHAIRRYNDFTTLLMTLVWNHESKK